jgi:hypothetical protein
MEVDPQLVAVQVPDQIVPGAAAPAASPSAASRAQN